MFIKICDIAFENRVQNMAMRKLSMGAILAIAVTGTLLSLLASGILMSYQNVPATGTVKTVNVGVYWDQECTNNVTSISWDFLRPGDAPTRTVYVKNNGTVPVTLSMTTANWSPSYANGPSAITLTWNHESYVLNATLTVQAVLTLSVSSSISENITDFSFNIIITGTEH
jgi:hypothetical protein